MKKHQLRLIVQSMCLLSVFACLAFFSTPTLAASHIPKSCTTGSYEQSAYWSPSYNSSITIHSVIYWNRNSNCTIDIGDVSVQQTAGTGSAYWDFFRYYSPTFYVPSCPQITTRSAIYEAVNFSQQPRGYQPLFETAKDQCINGPFSSNYTPALS